MVKVFCKKGDFGWIMLDYMIILWMVSLVFGDVVYFEKL